MRERSRLPVAAPVAVLLGVLAIGALCTAGAASVRHSVGGTVPTDRPRAALIPFENLAGREDQGTLFSRIFFAQLVATDAFDMVDPARVEVVIDSLALRGPGSLTPDQMRTLGDSLRAPYLLVGSVLESARVSAGVGDVPTVGATLRLIEGATGRVLWAGVHFRSGDDHEKVFGWGRVHSTERLISELATEMLEDFRTAAAQRKRSNPSEKPK
jgi:TolB-like protein